MSASVVICILLISIILYYTTHHDYKNKNGHNNGHNKGHNVPIENYCSPYKHLNMSGGESSYKCGCPCVSYGSLFDYQAQKKDQTYGVPNGCQKIF